MVDSPENAQVATGTTIPGTSEGNSSAAASKSKGSGKAAARSEAARLQSLLKGKDAELNFQSF
jgi:hypothetical protein